MACRKVSLFFTVCFFRRTDREPSQHSKGNPTQKKRKLDSKPGVSAFCDLATTEGEKKDRVNANESNSTDLVILEAELE